MSFEPALPMPSKGGIYALFNSAVCLFAGIQSALVASYKEHNIPTKRQIQKEAVAGTIRISKSHLSRGKRSSIHVTSVRPLLSPKAFTL